MTMADTQLSTTADVNYFVCTLGQAAALNADQPHPFKTVNEFIDYQAREHPSHPAIGFPIPPKDKETDKTWDYGVYSKW